MDAARQVLFCCAESTFAGSKHFQDALSTGDHNPASLLTIKRMQIRLDRTRVRGRLTYMRKRRAACARAKYEVGGGVISGLGSVGSL